MILTTVHPGPFETLELDATQTRDRLLELYRPPEPSWLRINLVVSLNGSVVGVDGTSETLTNKADRRILGVIRELSDVVLLGATSIRVEGFAIPKRARLAIVTMTGDLSGHRIEPGDAPSVIVLCPLSASSAVRATLGDAQVVELPLESGVAAGAPRIAAPTLIAALRGLGLSSIVCEGGPALAGQLLTAGLVDELCVTTSPKITPNFLAAFGGDVLLPIDLDLAQLILGDDGSLFARWMIRHS